MQGNVVVQHLAGKMRERVCGELIGSIAQALTCAHRMAYDAPALRRGNEPSGGQMDAGIRE